MKHIPGPWRVSSTSDYRISGADGIAVAVTDDVSLRRNYDEMAPNARRIVACVNACQGISTEDLEQDRHPGAAPSERDRLKAINAELLAALQELVKGNDPHGAFDWPEYRRARVAIARSKS